MDKAEVIGLVRAERALWNDLLAQLSDELMMKPGPDDGWSGKDILAHVMWYEREMIGMLRSRALIGSDLWALPVDERNAGVHEEIEDLTLQEVRAEADRVFPELMEQLELLPEEAYGESAHFEHMPSEWAPWDVIAGNTFRHYPEHGDSIRNLIERARE